MDRRSWLELGLRPAFFPAAAVVLGAALHRATTAPIGLFLLSAPAFLAFGLLRGSRVGGHLCVLFAALCLGAGLAKAAAHTDVPDGLESSPVQLEGEVEAVRPREGLWQVELAVGQAAGRAARFRVRLNTQRPVTWLPGQRVLVQTRLKPVEGPANWGEPDRATGLLRRGVVLTGSFEPGRAVTLSPPPRWRVAVEGERAALAKSVKRLAPTSESGALFLTLAAGLRAELGDALEETFSRSGLAHVLSVSGLHVAALALLLLRSLRALLARGWQRTRGLDVRRVAAPAAIPLVWSYVVFTGMQPPAVRSAVMASLMLLAMALWRRPDPLNGLALAATGLVCFDPSAVGDLSLQLSFLAVLSLILLSPALRQLVPIPEPDPARPHFRLQKLRETLLGTLCASVAVTLASLPLVATTFHRVSFAGLFSNIVALPLCGALTLLAAGAAALHVVHPVLATPLIFAGVWASQLLVKIAQVFAALPFAAPEMPSFGPTLALLFAVGLAAFALARGRARWVAVLAPAAILAAFAPGVPSRDVTVTFLSVGHGDAIVISSRGDHAIIDGGGVPGGADTGQRFVLPYLREMGVKRLALAALSHPHPDHALGLGSTLSVVKPERLWLPRGVGSGGLMRLVRNAAQGAQEEEVEVGHPGMALGDARIEVLGPPRDRELLEGVNDRSLVLRLTHGEVSFLLTGDIEAAAEEVLHPGRVTVLKAPHHGSRTSSTPVFVDEVRPRYVVFCVGKRNRFGFPHAEVEQRYRSAGAECVRTDIRGAVRFHSDGHSVRLESYLPGEPPSTDAVAPAQVATELP